MGEEEILIKIIQKYCKTRVTFQNIFIYYTFALPETTSTRIGRNHRWSCKAIVLVFGHMSMFHRRTHTIQGSLRALTDPIRNRIGLERQNEIDGRT